MRRHLDQNIERVLAVARQLGELAQEVVFVGGAATGLLVTDPAIADVRPTIDVDVIVEVISHVDYFRLQERLREKGFRESMQEEVICRWKYKEILLDVMPTDERILGFSNRWYAEAFRNAQDIVIDGMTIRLVGAPYFLGTKLEAFYGRGKADYMASHDLEDLITVLDGRVEIVEEVQQTEEKIKRYLADQFKLILEKDEFLDALPGHLPPDEASQQRVLIVEDRMRQIADIQQG
jgi:predicted nucleotidyltransferase